MAIKCIFESADDKATLIAWLRDANAGETERSVEFADIEGGAEPGNGYWDAGTSKVKAGLPHSMLPTTAEVNNYFNRVLDHMRTGWLTRANGDLVLSTSAARTRWNNTRYWLGSLHAAVTAAMASTTLTEAQKQFCWDAARSLAPDEPDKIAFWYRNHTVAAWTPFSGQFLMTNKQAYLGFRYTDTTLPAFASDAGAGVTWAGSGGTLNVMVTADWNGA